MGVFNFVCFKLVFKKYLKKKGKKWTKNNKKKETREFVGMGALFSTNMLIYFEYFSGYDSTFPLRQFCYVSVWERLQSIMRQGKYHYGKLLVKYYDVAWKPALLTCDD